MHILTLVLVFTLFGAAAPGVAAPDPRVASCRVTIGAGEKHGPLFATIGGAEIQVASEAVKAWRLDDGALLAYSSVDGAGGFENQGQSVWVFDPRTRKARRVLAEYFPVVDVKAARTRKGATMLVVQLKDGMSDAPHAALVDPARGQVWRKTFAEIVSSDGDQLRVKIYREKDWDEHHDNPGHAVKATGEKVFSISKLARGAVINNAPLR